jgi:hypothetical protein
LNACGDYQGPANVTTTICPGTEQDLRWFVLDAIPISSIDLNGSLRTPLAALPWRRCTKPSPTSRTGSFEGDGRQVFAAAEQLGLEGIMSKRAGSRYTSGRSRTRLSMKCMTEGEFVAIGMEPNLGGAPFAPLAREPETRADEVVFTISLPG